MKIRMSFGFGVDFDKEGIKEIVRFLLRAFPKERRAILAFRSECARCQHNVDDVVQYLSPWLERLPKEIKVRHHDIGVSIFQLATITCSVPKSIKWFGPNPTPFEVED